MSQYSIRDLEQLSGIKAHTLRIWEQRYNILAPQRTDTNIRFYGDEELKLILNISVLKDHGYKISEIAKFDDEELKREVRFLSESQLKFPDQINALTIAMIDLDEDAFEETVNHTIAMFGLEDTMINVIYPFLSKIGILWLTGSIGPSQEHFISNLIRQKIIVAIDNLPKIDTTNSEKIVIFNPEGEYHEIGILFANYIFKSQGKKVIYLGQSLPFEDVKFVIEKQSPHYVFTSITSFPSQIDVQFYLNKLGEAFPDIKIYLTGMQIVGQALSLTPNMKVIQTVEQLTQMK
jgi:DNA-binding transcriptional MerR regulator/methylmalonyl-CoA mutase cobalamin-binding subunit